MSIWVLITDDPGQAQTPNIKGNWGWIWVCFKVSITKSHGLYLKPPSMTCYFVAASVQKVPRMGLVKLCIIMHALHLIKETTHRNC